MSQCINQYINASINTSMHPLVDACVQDLHGANCGREQMQKVLLCINAHSSGRKQIFMGLYCSTCTHCATCGHLANVAEVDMLGDDQ